MAAFLPELAAQDTMGRISGYGWSFGYVGGLLTLAYHDVEDRDPDTALCGQDVTGYPWNPPWPLCEACLAIADGRAN